MDFRSSPTVYSITVGNADQSNHSSSIHNEMPLLDTQHDGPGLHMTTLFDLHLLGALQ